MGEGEQGKKDRPTFLTTRLPSVSRIPPRVVLRSFFKLTSECESDCSALTEWCFALCKVGGSPVVPIMTSTLPITVLNGEQNAMQTIGESMYGFSYTWLWQCVLTRRKMVR